MLEGLEKEAREAKTGLWVDPVPISPWVYRIAKRGQSLNLSDLVPSDAETDGSAFSRGPPLLGGTELDSASSTSPYPVISSATERVIFIIDQIVQTTVRLHHKTE